MTREERAAALHNLTRRYMDIFCEEFKVGVHDSMTREHLQLLKAVGEAMQATAQLGLDASSLKEKGN